MVEPSTPTIRTFQATPISNEAERDSLQAQDQVQQVFLNIGCGTTGIDRLPPMFGGGDWKQRNGLAVEARSSSGNRTTTLHHDCLA